MRRTLLVAAPILALAVVSCSGSTSPTAVRLLSVTPPASATGVNVTTPVVLTFNHAMMTGMENRIMLHEGSLAGPAVDGAAAWSANRTILTIAPRTPPKTAHHVRYSPRRRDTGVDGGYLDHNSCSAHGGRSITSGMLGDRHGSMMDDGWRGADDTYGMAFTFTTT